MLNQETGFADRRFWAVVYAEMLGQVSKPADPDVIYSLFGTAGEDAQGRFGEVVADAAADRGQASSVNGYITTPDPLPGDDL